MKEGRKKAKCNCKTKLRVLIHEYKKGAKKCERQADVRKTLKAEEGAGKHDDEIGWESDGIRGCSKVQKERRYRETGEGGTAKRESERLGSNEGMRVEGRRDSQ